MVALAAPAPIRVAEAVLRGRGFAPGLTQLPAVALTLSRREVDVVHAFEPDLAALAARWSARGPRPTVLTIRDTLAREVVADRRLRLRLLAGGVEGATALVVASDHHAAALLRWMARDSLVLAPDDAVGHADLYQRLRSVTGPGS